MHSIVLFVFFVCFFSKKNTVHYRIFPKIWGGAKCITAPPPSKIWGGAMAPWPPPPCGGPHAVYMYIYTYIYMYVNVTNSI